MPRLKKIEIYAISWLFSQKISPEDIAQELNLSIDQVIKSLEKNHPSGQEDVKIKTKTSPSKSKELMITATAGKKNNNVSIMTKEASEYNDSIKNKNIGETNKSIFRPKNNE
jgi:hypothetical protein